jgi:hypothetical protein
MKFLGHYVDLPIFLLIAVELSVADLAFGASVALVFAGRVA